VTSGFVIALPPEVLEQLVERVAGKLRAELADHTPWLTRREAAAYLRVPVSRLEKDKTVPSHRWEGRVLYHRAELDEWVKAQ
jgi:hypothetical protein